MSLMGDIRGILLANGAVSARVGTSRIYRYRLPQGVVDILRATAGAGAISMELVTDVPITAVDSQALVRRPVIQLNHFAVDAAIAETMDEETRAVLEGYRGSIGSRTGCTILRVDTREDLEPDLDLAYRLTEYQVWYN